MNPYQNNQGINFGATPKVNYGPMPKVPNQTYANLGGINPQAQAFQAQTPPPSAGPELGKPAPKPTPNIAAGMSQAAKGELQQKFLAGMSASGDGFKNAAQAAQALGQPTNAKPASSALMELKPTAAEINAYNTHIQNTSKPAYSSLQDFLQKTRAINSGDYAKGFNPAAAEINAANAAQMQAAKAGAQAAVPEVAGAAKGTLAKGLTKFGGFLGEALAPAIVGAREVPSMAKDVNTEGMDTADKIARVGEGASRIAGAGAGAAIGMGLGALTGPAAPLAIPVLGGVGGYLGEKLPEAGKWLYNKATGYDLDLTSEKAAGLQEQQRKQETQPAKQENIVQPQQASSEPNPPQQIDGVTHFNNAPAKDLLPGEKGTLTVPARAGQGLDSQAVPQEYAGGKGPTMPGVTGYTELGKPIFPGEGPATYSIDENGNVSKSGTQPMSGTYSQGGMFGEDWKRNAIPVSQQPEQVYYAPPQTDYSEAIAQLMSRAGQGTDMSSLGSMIKSTKDRKAARDALGPLLGAQTAGQHTAADYASKMAALGESRNRAGLLGQHYAQEQANSERDYALREKQISGDPRRQLYNYATQLSVARQMAAQNPHNEQMQKDLSTLEEQYKLLQQSVSPQYLNQFELEQ